MTSLPPILLNLAPIEKAQQGLPKMYTFIGLSQRYKVKKLTNVTSKMGMSCETNLID